MKLQNIHHVAVICSDYEKSKYFYVELLGLSVIHESYRTDRESYKLDLRVGDTKQQVELFSFPHPPERVNQPEARGLRHLAFTVANIQESIAELASKGISVESVRIDPITGQRYTFFSDPDGLPLELVEDAK
ncbi:VOC family protein [Paenibacillus sp. SYP-B3998]|uniref:VOC family protein n=1 Tax=Paenibacillus sp. SYP-B3998 TaxID=2678564 RepID=A0A6G4A3A2_9BACL|nr:VOC family protein [Paenibacillus sp. SYP-B3998]